MPIKPNFIERQVIYKGLVPAPLIDVAIPQFMMAAFIGASEIRLFEKMKEGPATISEIAQKTESNERALENLIQVLEHTGYVKEDNGKYKLTKYTLKSVPIETFHEMLPMFKMQAVESVKNVKTALQEAPESGIIGWDKVKDGEVGRAYQVAMRWLAGNAVDEVVKYMKMPNEDGKMIDIGGSHGLYCVKMCHKYPKMKATVLDWPIGIENAKETLEQETDVADRIDTLEADYNEDEFPKGYSMAMLGNIVHGNSPEENKALFKKIADSTTDNGKVTILDQFSELKGSKFAKALSSLMGWNLFLFSNGRAYEIENIKKWLKDVGFTKFEVHPLKKNPGFTVLIGSKK